MILVTYIIGMVFQSLHNTNVIIKLTSKHNGNGHWNSVKINEGASNKNHRVHEGTLKKYYRMVEK